MWIKAWEPNLAPGQVQALLLFPYGKDCGFFKEVVLRGKEVPSGA